MKTRNAVPINELTPHPDNVREGDIGAIALSLETHGQYRPIVVQESTGRIIAGNHTWKAAVQLGWKKIAATFIDVTDEQARRIMLVDNRTNDIASYDDAGLAELLVALAETPDGLAGTGYDGDDLEQLLRDLDDPLEFKKGRDGDTPPKPENPVTQLGDVWQLGEHTLTCGDAFDVVLTGDAIVTDPPYGMNLDTDFRYHTTGGQSGNHRPVIGDDDPFNPTPLFTTYKAMKEQFWFGADYYRAHLPGGGSWSVWDKRTDTDYDYTESGLDDVFGSHFELIWSRQPHKRIIHRFVWSGHHGMQRDDTTDRVHPTQKPVALLEAIIQPIKAKAILDPFAGSGSTLIACENLGRICHAIELDPGYCDVIIERYKSINPTATITKVN